MKRLEFAAVCAVLYATAAGAQDFPEKHVEMIIPFDAGGNTDLMARALQAEMSKSLGQPLVPVNKPGAAATLGTAEVARSKTDGYTIGMMPVGPLAIQPSLRKLPYDAFSFDYICQTYDVPIFLMVPKSSPFKTVADVVAYAKENPAGFLYGSSGPGTMPHVATAAFLEKAGIKGTHVPFKGSGEMAQALLSGTIMAFSEAPSLAVANDLRLLAVFSAEREKSNPDVPTMRELGYDFVSSIWGGLIAPKGLAEPVLAKLEHSCETAAKSEAYTVAAKRLNSVPTYKNSKDFGAFVKSQAETLGDVVKATGLVLK